MSESAARALSFHPDGPAEGSPTHFAFLQAEWPEVHDAVRRAEQLVYADCLEQQFGQRPVIFYSNGYDHWLWDDERYPPRAVQGFLFCPYALEEHACDGLRLLAILKEHRYSLQDGGGKRLLSGDLVRRAPRSGSINVMAIP